MKTITLTIGSAEETFSNLDSLSTWMNEQVERRKRDNRPLDIEIQIKEGSQVDIRLKIPPSNGGGTGRTPRPKEEYLVSVWRDLGLSDAREVNAQLVLSFLRIAFNA